MKIQPKSKKAIPPSSGVADLISKLLSYSDDQLAAFLKEIDVWKWPRSDLNAWIKVLNKFDDIMDGIIQEHNVEKLQLVEFNETTKDLLSQILRFERLLLENSTNRKTFSSYDRLNSLLSASDLDIVILALNVLLRPAQQYSSQPAVSHALSISTSRLQSLAKRWSHLRENEIGLVELTTTKHEDVEGIPMEAKEASLTFYKTDAPTATEQKADESPEIPPTTPRKAQIASPAASNAVQVRIDEQTIQSQPIMNVLSDAIKVQSLPESESFEMLCRIRAAAVFAPGKRAEREKLLIVRLLAIAIYGHTHNESQATTALFLYEPDLVTHISELLQVDQGVPVSVQTAAISALDALARYKSKLQEVLTAVNAGVNHGILLSLVRNMVSEVTNPDSTLPHSFVDSLLAFITYLASHASGGNMVVSAGLVPLLIQIIEARNPKRLPVVSKTMQLVDNVIYTFPNAFSLFTTSRGVETLVERIEHEIDNDIKEHAAGHRPCALSGLGELPIQRTAVLKHILRSTHRMMQSSGSAEGLRGLIDTSLLKSIKKIVEYRGLFGSTIFPLAINIMATFVHNEPTSLGIIQEAGLPNLFYRAIEVGIEPAIEVIQAIPNAIGALCLNDVGQTQLANRPSVLPAIISLFTSEKHLKVLIDKENAVVIGSAVDELIRHHPTLKYPIFEALKATFGHIEAMGLVYHPPDDIKHWYHIVPQQTQGTSPDDDVSMQDSTTAEGKSSSGAQASASAEREEDDTQEKTHDNLLVNYIDVLGRFLEGFFQHPHHCKDFVLNTDGLERIGRITALPCLPYDFANSVASDSMVQVLRTMTEVATNETLLHLTEIVRISLDATKPFWEDVQEASRLLPFVELADADEASANQQFRDLVTLHIRITLLSDVFGTAGQSQGRTAISLLQTLLDTAPRQVLTDLGALHRSSAWENIALHRGLASKGIETASTPAIPVDDGPVDNSGSQSVIDGGLLPPVSANGVIPEASSSAVGSSVASSKPESAKDWNAAALKHITQGLPNALAPFFQAMVKMFHARRNPDSVQKKQILESSKLVADILVKHLGLQNFTDRGSLFNYYSAMLELFALLLIDERSTSTNTLHTVAIVAFWRGGGLQKVIDICDSLIDIIDELAKIPEDSRSDEQKKNLLHAYGAIKFAMHLTHPIISSKPIFESGQTTLITSRDKKYGDPDYFEAHDFLVKVRLAALPIIRRIWDSEWIVQAPLGVSRYVVRSVLEIANGENEESKGPDANNPLLPPVVPRSQTPTEAQIRTLTDMGFPRSAVERALLRTNNDINAATELLLSHPFPLAPDPPELPAPAADPPTEPQDDDDDDQDMEERATEATPEPAETPIERQPSPNSEDSPEESTPSPPGKTAEQWRTELNEAREPLKSSISRQSLRLIDEHLSLLFDLHIAFTKTSGHQQDAIRNLIEDVSQFSPNAYDVQEQPLANRCRLLALVLCETPSSLDSSLRNTLMDHLLALLLSTRDIEHPPKWLAAHLLVTEALFTLADEPRSIPAPVEGVELVPDAVAAGPSRDEAKATVFEFCLKLLANEELPADELLSVLRLFVLLTRNRQGALQFVEKDGLSLLLKRLKKSSVTGGSSYIASILRHIVEDGPTIQTIMQQTIKRYFNQPRTRIVDLPTYVRNCSAIALRDVHSFIDVTNSLCQVENPFSPSPLIKLQPTSSTEKTPGVDTETSGEMQVDNPPAVTTNDTQKTAEAVVHLLTSELMSTLRDNDVPPQPKSPKDGNMQDSAMAVEGQAAASSEDNNITATDEQDRNQYACFVMQCLTELLFSYDSCKVAFLSFSSKKRPAQSQPKEPTSKFRTTTLYFLFSELITYGTINPAPDSKHRARGTLCSWAMNLIGALCVDTSAAQDIKEVSNDLILVRKFVLETISRAMKDVSSLNAHIEARYGRLLALADLCHRLLVVRVNPTTRKQQEEVPTHLAKIMLEKGYVATLTNALSEVDLNYPNMRHLVLSILRPLDSLTKIAIKMSKASSKGKEDVRQDEVQTSTSEDEDDAMDDNIQREETPDLYRNSALGMYGGQMDDRQFTDDEQIGDSEDDQDVEMDYGDETGSEDTSASESQSDEDPLEEGTHTSGERWEEDDEDEDLIENPNNEDDDDDDDDEDDDDDDGEADDGGDDEVEPDEDEGEEDEDVERGMIWEDVQPPEGLGMLLQDAEDEAGLGVPIQVNQEEDEPDLGSEEEYLMDQGHINPEGLIDFNQPFFGGGIFVQRRHRGNADPTSYVRSRNAQSAPETITHPLLLDITANNRTNTGPQARIFRAGSRLIGGAPPEFAQALHMLNEGGIHVIQHQGGEMFHIQVPINAAMLQQSRRFITARPERVQRATSHRQGREFDPLLTLQRWAEEMKILHGDFVPERAGRLANHLLIAMLPAALEAQRQAKLKAEEAEAQRKEEEEKEEALRKEEEAKKKEEEESKPAQQQPTDPPPVVPEPQRESGPDDTGRESSTPTLPAQLESPVPQPPSPAQDDNLGPEDTVMAETPTNESDQDSEMADASQSDSPQADAQESVEVPEPTAGPSSEPAPRVTVTIHGSVVDITDTGIDPTFLEALPDDMREEVLNQHVRDQRASRVERPPDSQISTEFLDALPPDIRAEIIQQEAMERARRRTEETNRGPPREAAEIDAASFIASLDPNLRQAVLLEQDETFIQTLPSHMIAEAGAYRDDLQARRARNPIRPPPTTTTPQIKKYAQTHDAVMLLDRTGIAVLLRLLFYPQVLKKTLLFRVLVNLCENTKSRTELFNLLLGILQDGTGDLMAVDKSFAQMSVRNRDSKPSTPKSAGKQKMNEYPLSGPLVTSQGEAVPDLIAQRCLEALASIVNANESFSLFFLTEHEVPAGLRRPVGKKGKGKEKYIASSHFPLVLLLNLLDRQNLLKTPSILESVVTLLANVTRPLTTLKEQTKASELDPKLPPATLSGETVATQPSSELPPIVQSQVPEPTVTSATSAASAGDPVSSDKADKKATAPAEDKSPLPQPPQIPHTALRLIVNILTTGECSSRTFTQSLALIQHLSFIPDARDVIASELKAKAQECGQVLYADLDELAVALQANHSPVISSSVATKFSPASSTQAKLLRVLKTIDYMYTPKNPSTNPSDPTTTSNEDIEKVQAIYESFRFTPLWRRLGDCLSSIDENSEHEHIATVLLPLIEALMVVCKFVGSKGAVSRLARAASISSPRSPTTPKESMEDLFISFTDAHRKVLNLMVRNNPSLMSGSFSLLVNNSRVLDFDNKRNYFNQQLHRRPREYTGTLQLNVRRARVFEDSFIYLQRKTGEQIKHGKLSVRFYDEEGVDAGGLTREWFQILARQMFNPDYALFQPCAADKLTYQPNKASWVNPEHLSFFKFVGRVIGKAIYDGRLLDAYFARSLYRQILGKPVDYRDVEWVDPEYYNSLCWILENDPTVLDLTFSVEGDEFGVNKIVALKEGGENIQVTNENKREYVQLSAQYRLYSSIKDQIENLVKGFYEIIPKDLITIFNEQELELLISGTPDVDVDEWRAATEYNGYSSSDPNIVWWWRALKSFNREERAKVLSFATGTSRVPLNGFLDLQGVQGVQKFSIHRAYGEPDRLPQAHTCFNQIDLPPYTSYEMLRQQLLLAINEGGEGFAFS